MHVYKLDASIHENENALKWEKTKLNFFFRNWWNVACTMQNDFNLKCRSNQFNPVELIWPHSENTLINH